jgi:hypothetical protein
MVGSTQRKLTIKKHMLFLKILIKEEYKCNTAKK